MIPTTYTGPSWERIRVDLVHALDAANGRMRVGGVYYPRLSNGQAVAVLEAWRRLVRSYRIAVPLWPEAWSAAFAVSSGRPNVSTAHAVAPAPAAVVEAVWKVAERAAADLDRRNAQPLLLVVDWTYASFARAGSELREQLVKERAPVHPKVPSQPLPSPPVDPTQPGAPGRLPSLVPSRSAVLLLVLVALAITLRGK